MRIHITIPCLLILLFLTACNGAPATLRVESLRVTGIRPLEISGSNLPRLSPNGSRFAALVDDMICIYSIDGVQQACSTEMPAEYSALAWSSDSQKIAYTENFLNLLHESDLYILSPYGVQSNLTEDNVEYNARGMSNNVPRDFHPAWYALDNQIAFLRWNNENNTYQLMSIAVSGSEPVELDSWEFEMSALLLLKSSPAGWLLYGHGDTLYRLDPDSGQKTVLYTIPSADQRFLTDARFSADGKYLMLWFKNEGMAILSSDGKGELLPITDNPNQGAFAAGWAPSGSAYAFIAMDAQTTQRGLFLVQEPGMKPKAVQYGFFRSVYGRNPNLNSEPTWIDWASNNTLLLLYADAEDYNNYNPVILQLGP